MSSTDAAEAMMRDGMWRGGSASGLGQILKSRGGVIGVWRGRRRRYRFHVATLKDIAQETGLGLGTVSRALSGAPKVSPATRRKVEQAAKRLGYQTNALARALRQSQSKAVGLVIPDIENEFYTSGAAILQDVFAREGYRLVLCCSNSDPETDAELLASLVERRVDGIAHTPCSPQGAQVIRTLSPTLPIVEYARRSELDSVDSVTGDEQRGSAEIVDHLVGLGHASIAMITGPKDLSTTQARLAGFDDACRRQRLRRRDCPRLVGAYDAEWGREATLRILRDHPGVTAIYASSSRIVLGVLETLREAGVSIPDDMSVVGFLNPRWYGVASPPLTTYELPLKEMGDIAARLLLQRIDAGSDQSSHERRSVRIEGRLVVRQSTSRPRVGPVPRRMA
ncbi:LacI family DNA-binding transcriptional regulator [Streptomyces spinosisporus]|uniref:LacI family transcriptional regulator n=1 Tax=Streptomyces spinosisporus TaxID=2927582 RepID=A0ABS9XSG8_9ACTN|nr:LacI family DNA-binding transcriptional regulator [Streptomyces spinosisporus]MCI3244885.1 LacI family transcriptional regulator [Streptomyces spinosisporus]